MQLTLAEYKHMAIVYSEKEKLQKTSNKVKGTWIRTCSAIRRAFIDE